MGGETAGVTVRATGIGSPLMKRARVVSGGCLRGAWRRGRRELSELPGM